MGRCWQHFLNVLHSQCQHTSVHKVHHYLQQEEQFLFSKISIRVTVTMSFLAPFYPHYHSHIQHTSVNQMLRIAQLVESQTCDWKVVCLIPGRSSGRIFFSRVNFCADSYLVSTKLLYYCSDKYMGRTRLKFESWKVRIYTQNASQSHYYCFLKDISILKFGCSLKSSTHTCRRPKSFCEKCRWQVTPKHAYILDPVK